MNGDPAAQRRDLALALGLALAPRAPAADVDDATLTALMDGRLDETRRGEVAQALEASPRLRERWRLAMAARDALANAAPVRRSARPGPVLGWFALAAALGLMAITVVWQRPTPLDPLVRDPATTQIVVAFGDAFLQMAREKPRRAPPAIWQGTRAADHPLAGGFAAGVAFVAQGLAAPRSSWDAVAASAERIVLEAPCRSDACSAAAGLGAWAVLASLDCPAEQENSDLKGVRDRLLADLTDAVPAEWAALDPCDLAVAVGRAAGFGQQALTSRQPTRRGECLKPMALPSIRPETQAPEMSLYEFDLHSKRRKEQQVVPGQALAMGTRLELCVDLPRAGHITVWSFDRNQTERIHPADPVQASTALAAGRHCGRELGKLVNLCGVPGETLLLVHWSERGEDALPADAFGPLSKATEGVRAEGALLRPPLGDTHRLDFPLTVHGAADACVGPGGAS